MLIAPHEVVIGDIKNRKNSHGQQRPQLLKTYENMVAHKLLLKQKQMQTLFLAETQKVQYI